jgi:6-pyruvoyltetrahydropterin/6-carboxytetrahydropterin synthase
MFLSTKEYGHEIGLSCCFRQWKAESHCNKMHGYAIAVKFVFTAVELDHRNWVVDFGSLKTLKQRLQDTFDHKVLVARDDPWISKMVHLDSIGLLDLVVVEAVGCEMFASMVFDMGQEWLVDNQLAPRVQLLSVEVKEHGANSAIRLNEGAHA